METGLRYFQTLAAGVLIGKIALLSFVVAPMLAAQLDRPTFARVVRRLFPAYYAMGMGAAGAGLLAVAGLGVLLGPRPVTGLSAGLWLLVLAAEWYCRSSLTPRSNRLRDELKQQEEHGAVSPALQAEWEMLHRRSLWLNSLVLVIGLCVLGLITFMSLQGGV